MCILQHPDLTITSEERVLNAVLLWCLRAQELFGWEKIDEMLLISAPESLSGDRFESLNVILPHVRFSQLPCSLLKTVSDVDFVCLSAYSLKQKELTCLVL